jgi:Putative binding domain, N-terminal/G8 domain
MQGVGDGAHGRGRCGSDSAAGRNSGLLREPTSIFGQLAFGTGAPTRLIVGMLTVMEGGVLTVGTMSAPVPAGIRAELVIANQPLNTNLDPDRFGTGLLGLGTVTIHGAEKTPTLQFNHFGARDRVTGNGTLRLLPRVGNLTRDVVVRSQSPIGSGGMQGYTFFIGRANVDIRYVAFRDLGRTVTVNVDANIGLSARTGTLTIAGQTVTVTQEGLLP